MRLFVSINIPDDVKEDVGRLYKRFSGIRFVPLENLHITLKFLGESEPEPIVSKLKEIDFSTFSFTLKGVGAFPNKEFPRVVWIGVGSGKEKIVDLAQKVDSLLADIRKDDHPFHPHLTIARVRGAIDKKIFDYSYKSRPIVVDSFYLMKSILTPLGPQYKVIKRFKSNE